VRSPVWRLAALALTIAPLACGGGGDDARLGRAATTTVEQSTTAAVTATTAPAAPTTGATPTTTAGPQPAVRPDWLGTRPLPLRADGFGEILPTPPELVDRRLATVDLLPPPADGGFAASVAAVPSDVVTRSSWQPACPVTLDQLRYVNVTFWGFDDRAHTGELLVNASVADGMVDVFRRLFDARFPIEEMRIIRADEIDAHPTGDGNTTTSFVCRPAVGSGSWSRHAYGLAVDVNPFHNPYVRGDLVLPELASAYVDRTSRLPGMIVEGDAVVDAFGGVLGWGWGGRWHSLLDYMHFSDNNR
jgi:D-alanyl-D-alanine carboxypeptidase